MIGLAGKPPTSVGRQKVHQSIEKIVLEPGERDTAASKSAAESSSMSPTFGSALESVSSLAVEKPQPVIPLHPNDAPVRLVGEQSRGRHCRVNSLGTVTSP